MIFHLKKSNSKSFETITYLIDNCSLNEVSCFACEITLTAVKVLQIDVHHY